MYILADLQILFWIRIFLYTEADWNCLILSGIRDRKTYGVYKNSLQSLKQRERKVELDEKTRSWKIRICANILYVCVSRLMQKWCKSIFCLFAGATFILFCAEVAEIYLP